MDNIKSYMELQSISSPDLHKIDQKHINDNISSSINDISSIPKKNYGYNDFKPSKLQITSR